MPGTYTRWYRVGSVKVTLNSTSVVGTNTYWLTAGINPGDLFTTTDGKQFIEILSVQDDTHLTLATPYIYENNSGIHYAICRNFTAHVPSQIAADTAKLINDMARYWDEDLLTLQGESAFEIAKRTGATVAASELSWAKSLQGDSAYKVAKSNGYSGTEAQWLASLVGKSAYEVAVANGYTGTAAQWLESLKAAGEWSAASSRLDSVESRATALETIAATLGTGGLPMNAATHNFIFRGKNLGSAPTAEQYANIKNGSFKDMYIGDYWDNGSQRCIIADFNYFRYFYHWWNYTADQCGHTNHVVCIVTRTGTNASANYSSTWKADGDISGNYYSSDIRALCRGQITTDMKAFFGEDHLMYHIESIPNAANTETGATTGSLLVLDSCVEITSWMHKWRHLGYNILNGYLNTSWRGRFALYRLMWLANYYSGGRDWTCNLASASTAWSIGFNEIWPYDVTTSESVIPYLTIKG